MSITFPLSVPASPFPKHVSISSQNIVGVSTSPFTGESDVQEWPGEWLQLEVTLPPIRNRIVGEQWTSFLVSLRGQSGTFLYGDPSLSTPMGTPTVPNLLKWSEAFDNALWSKGSSTVSPNTGGTTAPNGTLTADKLVESTANSAHNLNQAESVTGVPRCMSVYAKAAGRTILYIQVGISAAYYNLSTVTTSNVSVGCTAAMTDVGNGWYRCAFYSPSPTSTTRSIGTSITAGQATYTGDGTSGIYLWGAQLEAASTASTYIGTTTGTPLCNGTQAAGSKVLATYGWPISATIFRAGDYLQVGTSPIRLYKIVKDATSDASGNATVDIFPRLREALNDNTAITVTNPVGTWRLNANKSTWSKDEAGFYTISFSAMEAL